MIAYQRGVWNVRLHYLNFQWYYSIKYKGCIVQNGPYDGQTYAETKANEMVDYMSMYTMDELVDSIQVTQPVVTTTCDGLPPPEIQKTRKGVGMQLFPRMFGVRSQYSPAGEKHEFHSGEFGTFDFSPGDWLVDDGNGVRVVSDEDFNRHHKI